MFNVKNIPVHPDYYKYPFSDGEPMAESTTQADWIETIKGNVDAMTEGQDVFVAMDLLWYPVQGRKDICKAPDVMVAIGRPKGPRLSYLQWHEDNVPPQVVFEILSKSNRRRMNKENLLEFYTKYGVEEYYSYDPVDNTFVVHVRQDSKLVRLEGLQKWVSPLLQICFEWSENSFKIYRPDGQLFLTFNELERKTRYLTMEFEEVKALRSRERRLLTEAEEREKLARLEADFAKVAASSAQEEAASAREEAASAKIRQLLLEEKLKALGIDPSGI